MTVETQSWAAQAKCRGTGDDLFVAPPEQKQVRMICEDCPVRIACLAEALDAGMEWGVWGGKTERERRQILRRRPDVKSWKLALVGP